MHKFRITKIDITALILKEFSQNKFPVSCSKFISFFSDTLNQILFTLIKYLIMKMLTEIIGFYDFPTELEYRVKGTFRLLIFILK